MNKNESTIDLQEVQKFSQQASYWWDLEGPFKTLHDINPVRLEFILAHKPLAGLRVLDLGCGGGILSEALAKSGANVTGIDAAVEGIEAAKVHAKDNGLAIDYLCMPVEDYDGAPFDVIVCMEMLEHVQKPELILQQCKRLLKPEGLLFVSTISRTFKAYASAVIAAEYVLGLLPKQTHDYHKFIKPSELASMARHQGFELLNLQGMDYNPFSRKASLGQDVSVNYVMSFQLPKGD